MYHHPRPPLTSANSPIFIRGVGFIPPREAFGESRESVATALLSNQDVPGGNDDGKPEREEYPKGGIIRVHKPWYVDLGLRLAGLCAIGLAALSIYLLMGLVQHAPQHSATWIEMALAAVGFLGASLGSVLLFLGAHIYDRVIIASRWRTMR
ncbi:hypothetical protein [Novosphingobium album (ex Liu et al. 2023)]|uniref:Uncharacterized protein n=1 Tax=Novosphingobium album (ex Liu et al. 2023) TaxID=3031130 RepID=A0ABT5WN53_9SPHN|nr:hypothetical protein [Novosphingobium album (ex Liu et al. 2023)]MDE8651473.1 hypothetical protein [Novosphingobium album (ex Liu et al. 2023)]